MIAVSEKYRIIEDADCVAVCAMIALGPDGWQSEAYFSDSLKKAVAVISDATSTKYAELTINQFNSLSDATDWETVGAQAANDARIIEAAHEWFEARNLDWYRISKDGSRFISIES